MSSELATLLRLARSDAGLSQLELSLRLGVSQRHVNFVERGRARPSRELLLAWLREVDCSRWICNAALLQAGYAPLPEPSKSPAVAAVPSGSDAVVLNTIALHHPNPAFVFDADWRIVRMNAAARWICQVVMPGLWNGDERLDMLAVLAHPDGWLARAREPAVIAAALLGQLRAEQWLRPSLIPRIDELERVLQARYGRLDAPQQRDPSAACLNVLLDTCLGSLSFSAVQILVGLPHDTAGTRLRAELWFPANRETSAVMLRYEPAMAELSPA